MLLRALCYAPKHIFLHEYCYAPTPDLACSSMAYSSGTLPFHRMLSAICSPWNVTRRTMHSAECNPAAGCIPRNAASPVSTAARSGTALYGRRA
eukprot:3886231-Rhodomonas_salina.1